MPNWVQNRIKFAGPFDMAEFRERYGTDDTTFDFNKIIPMPEDIYDADTDFYIVGLRALAAARNPSLEYTLNGIEKMSEDEYAAFVAKLQHHPFSVDGLPTTQADVERMLEQYGEYIGQAVPNAIAYMRNVDKYGYGDWYDWSCAKWGTKWNAHDVFYAGGDAADTLLFTTAWSMPYPVLQELSAQMPGVTLYCEYADEDYLSGNCGLVVFKDGKCAADWSPADKPSKLSAFSEHVWDDDDMSDFPYGNIIEVN